MLALFSALVDLLGPAAWCSDQSFLEVVLEGRLALGLLVEVVILCEGWR